MPRTDTYQLTVLNHTTGARHSSTGSEKECEREGAEKAKEWKGDKTEIVVEKRK
jgi:hypothetical protein